MTIIPTRHDMECQEYIDQITEMYEARIKGLLEQLNRNSELPTEEGKICKWREDEDYEYFDTECGEAYCLIDGTLEENKYKYCPFCGSKINLLKGER